VLLQYFIRLAPVSHVEAHSSEYFIRLAPVPHVEAHSSVGVKHREKSYVSAFFLCWF